MFIIFTLCYCIVIVTIYCISSFFFNKNCQKLIKNISEANHNLDEFEQYNDIKTRVHSFFANFSSLNDKIRIIDIFITPWAEFCQNLFLPTNTKIDSNNCYHSTYSASFFFNDQTIINPNINPHLITALPNYLTGLGILGTFIGLTFGIISLQTDQGDIESLKNALNELLNGAGMAFTSSICGLLLSLSYSLKEKLSLNRINKMLDHWNDTLDSCTYRATSEEYGKEHIVWLEKQHVEAVNQSSILHKHYGFTQKASEDQIALLKEQRDLFTDFSTTIAVNLSNQLREALSPTMLAIIGELKQIREVRQEESKSLVESIVNNFKESLNESTKDHMTNLGNTFEKMNLILTPLVERFQEIFEKNTNLLYTISGVIEQINPLYLKIDSIVNKMTICSNQLIQYIEKSQINTDNSISKLIETVESTLLNMKELINSSVSTLEKKTVATNQSLQDVVKSALETLASDSAKSTKSILDTVLQATDALTRSVEKTSLSTNEAVKEASQLIASSTEKSSLALEENIKTANDMMIKSIHETNSALENNIKLTNDMMVKSIHDTNSAFFEANKSATEKMADSVVKSSTSIQKAIESAESACHELKEQQNSLRKEYQRNIDSFTELIKSIESQHESLKLTWDNYEDRFNDLDKSLEKSFVSIDNGYQAFLNQSVSYLNELDKTLSNSVNNLRAVIAELSDNLNGYLHLINNKSN
jgi:hypothetical protein